MSRKADATRSLVISAMLTALVCVATILIKIPTPMRGYINLGDGVILLSAWLMPCGYGFLIAGIGSALADIISGYIIYAPATFVIKGIMAVIAYAVVALLSRKGRKVFALLIGGIVAETVMILGYFLFEGILYGFIPSLVNIPANAVQGVAGITIGILLIKLFEKAGIAKRVRKSE